MAFASTFWLNNFASFVRQGQLQDKFNSNLIWANPSLAQFDDGTSSSVSASLSGSGKSEGDGFLPWFGGSGLSNPAIPSNAIIEGLTVIAKRRATQYSTVPQWDGNSGIAITDDTVRLIYNGNFIGDNKANPSSLWSHDTYNLDEFGGPTDTWGVSGGLTPSILNSAGFGISIGAYAVFANIPEYPGIPAFQPPFGYSNVTEIDYLEFTVFYGFPGNTINHKSIPTDESTGKHTLKATKNLLPKFDSAEQLSNTKIVSNINKFSIQSDENIVVHTLYATNVLKPKPVLSDESIKKQTVIKDDEPLGEPIYSDYLIAKKLFSQDLVPNDAIVKGITVDIVKKGRAANSNDWYGFDNIVKLIVNNNILGENKADTSTKWPENFETFTYGSENDKWGLNLTGADVNSNNFGVAVNLKFFKNIEPVTVDFEIDFIQIKICYAPSPISQTINPKPIVSQQDLGKPKLRYDNYGIVWKNQIFSPSYEMGYFDVMALSNQQNIDPNFDLPFDSLNTNYLFSVNNINLNYRQNANFDKRLAGEGANPSTFKIDTREFSLDFSLPIKVETWGYADTVFSALYDYFIQGYKGSPTTFVARMIPNNNIAIGSTNKLFIDNISDFAGIGTSFTAYIRSEDGSETSESVIIETVSKSTKTLNLKNNTIYNHTPNKSYIWTNPINPENNREPSFNLFSLREGLLSGCMVDKITLSITPGSTLEASVSVKFTDLNREYQKNILSNFDSIMTNINNRRPNYLINGSQVSMQSTNNSSAFFGLGRPKDSKLFRGFQEELIRDFEINEITLEFNNNLQPIYTLNSKKSNNIENFNKNLQPFAYYSNGRSITGSIKYSSPIKPWLFAEKLAGPDSINRSGLIFNFGSFKLTLPEIIWTPESSNSSVENVHQKSVSFQVSSSNLIFDPYLEPTGQL